MRIAKRCLIAAGVLLAAVLLAAALLERFPPRDWIVARASDAIGREVTVERLSLTLLTLRPRIEVDGLHVRNPGWAGPGNAISSSRVTVALDLLHLLRGRVIYPLVAVETPALDLVRDGSGRMNWYAPGPHDDGPGFGLPTVHRLVVTHGYISLRDGIRDLFLQGTLAAQQDARKFLLRSEGALNGQRYTFELGSEPLTSLMPGESWPCTLQVRTPQTRIDAIVTLRDALDLRHFEVALDVSGSDLARGYELSGLPLPSTPPYDLVAHVRREGDTYRIGSLDGTVGDSDVHGSAFVDVSGERPFVTAAIHSAAFDLDDLATAVGAPPGTGTLETASAQQRKLARHMKRRKELLPREPLRVERLKQVDAELSFAAETFRTEHAPIRSLSFDLKLRSGQLVLDPITVELSNGRIAGRVDLDANPEPPRTTVDLSVAGVSLAPLTTVSGEDGARSEPPLEGTMQGRVRLDGRGYSVHESAGTTDGAVTLVVPNGRIRRAFAELTGINVAEGLGLLLSGDTEQTGVRCAVAHFIARKGTLGLDSMIVDTDDVLITGQGNIDLGAERFDIELEGRPKKPRLLRLRSGITIEGPLRDPELGLEEENLLAQGLAGAALGTLVGPIAALLTLVDPGLAKDRNCAALVAEAHEDAQAGA